VALQLEHISGRRQLIDRIRPQVQVQVQVQTVTPTIAFRDG
jgi:hypothetical protein